MYISKLTRQWANCRVKCNIHKLPVHINLFKNEFSEILNSVSDNTALTSHYFSTSKFKATVEFYRLCDKINNKLCVNCVTSDKIHYHRFDKCCISQSNSVLDTSARTHTHIFLLAQIFILKIL